MIDYLSSYFSFDVRPFVSVIAIVGIALLLYLTARRGLTHLSRKGTVADPPIRVLRIVLRWLLVTITILLILQELGVLQNVWAAVLAVAAMIAIGFFAVWSVLSNTLCTLLILIYKPFRIGDFVELPSENVSGEATDLNLMFTTLKTDADELVQIPNNLFFQKVLRRKPGSGKATLYEQFLK
jgi:small-conductance mechanosensitive channel